MAILVAVHRTPKDPAAYDRHYFTTHVPLAKALPGLRRYEVSTGPFTSGPTHEPDIHLIALMHFDDADAARSSLNGPEGDAALADLPNFAETGNIQLLVLDTREV